MTKPRGRPRAYDPDVALDAALDVFWTKGYDATSLEDLRQATGMNRPSLYAAFGNKANIYRLVLQRFRARVRDAVTPALEDATDLRHGLVGYYHALAELYAPSNDEQTSETGRGCLVLTTASIPDLDEPGVREQLSLALAEIDDGLAALYRWAQQQGELASSADLDSLVWLAAAVQHSLSLRARAGASAGALASAAEISADLVLAAGRASTAQ